MNKNGVFKLVCVASLLVACNDEAQDGIKTLDTLPAFAVQRGDFMGGGSIALLDEDGTLIDEEYISSGTNKPGLSAALVGDLFLPTSPCDAQLLTVGGRLGGDYIVQVDLKTSDVVRQVKTQDEPEGAVFSSNPQDLLCLPDGRALVSRLGLNLSAKATSLDRGDDLAVIDLEAKKVSARIDLQSVEDTLPAQGDAPEEVAYASPGSIVRVGEKHALVGLSRLTQTAWRPHPQGLILLVDIEKLRVEEVALEGLANCGALFAVPGVDNAAVVQGAGAPYGSMENAGLAYVSVEAGKARVEHVFQEALNDVPLTGNPTPVGDAKVIVASADFIGGTPDVAYLVDMASGTYERLFEATAPGDIGSGAVHPKTGLVLLPDVTVGIRVLSYEGGRVVEKRQVPLSGTIPARYIRPLRAL